MPTGENFWLPIDVRDRMVDLADEKFPLETGGMLLGYQADNGDAVVTAIIGPGPNARHRRYRFTPDPDYQQAQLEAHFWKTDGRETYLGDWHTHPRGPCALTFMDKRTLHRIACTTSSGTTRPIMMVLAGSGEGWTLGGARYLSARYRLCFIHCGLRPLVIRLFHRVT